MRCKTKLFSAMRWVTWHKPIRANPTTMATLDYSTPPSESATCSIYLVNNQTPPSSHPHKTRVATTNTSQSPTRTLTPRHSNRNTFFPTINSPQKHINHPITNLFVYSKLPPLLVIPISSFFKTRNFFFLNNNSDRIWSADAYYHDG